MQPNLAAQASQAAAQGQQMLQDDQSKAAGYQGQYNQYQGQADAANKQVGDYTTAMAGSYDAAKGTGNAQSAFDYNQGQQLSKVGYDSGLASDATRGLSQALGAQSAYNNFINSASSKFGGIDSGAFAAFNANGQAQNNQNVNQASQLSNALMSKYTSGSAVANTVVGQQQEGEKNTLAGYQQQFANAASQRDSAASMMNFYSNLASSQGGLNAQQQQYYAAAQQAYAGATAAMAQAGLYGKQADKIQQEIDFNKVSSTPAAAPTPVYHPAAPTPNASPGFSWSGLGNRVKNDVTSGFGNFERSIGMGGGSSQPSASQQALNAQRAAGKL